VEKCIGGTGRSIETNYEERKRHVRLYQPDKSRVAESNIKPGHRISYKNSQNMGLHGPTSQRDNRNETASGFLDREDEFRLSKAWNPST
jgi:hypothetical protein